MKNNDVLETITPDFIAQESDWLMRVFLERVIRPTVTIENLAALETMPAEDTSSYWGKFLKDNKFNPVERMALSLSMLAAMKPTLLHEMVEMLTGAAAQRELTLHAIVIGEKSQLPAPTLQTFLILFAGTNADERCKYMYMFAPQHPLFRRDLLRISKEDGPGNSLGCVIYASPDLMSIVLAGHIEIPEFSPEFPAKRIETKGEWSDLVLEAATLRQVQEVAHWVTHEHHIMDELGMRKKIRPGYRALFYGPPGTGKTFTCALLGKSTGLPVYRVDLSLVVSKYIGETEKNLARVFNHAEKHKWILFFDEADALFGKRTAVSDARDRFANQEVSYLLQKVEEYDGVVILATNFKGNIDMAFTRRFENMVHFPMPSAKERELIWRATLPAKLPLAPDIDLQKVAEKFDLSGASIVDAVRAAVLLSVAGKGDVLLKSDLMEAIQREYYKFGRVCEI